ncbi:hypothetical protein [uncultured Tateyamaria sp.]|uniref:hypothetical protein n=1 Tax=uncultured Tateyamaria sp. TaxID=455651 RepID=UPI0026329CDC|nr:hypothetical protein [uncultured Tateyamaria sp.]
MIDGVLCKATPFANVQLQENVTLKQYVAATDGAMAGRSFSAGDVVVMDEAWTREDRSCSSPCSYHACSWQTGHLGEGCSQPELNNCCDTKNGRSLLVVSGVDENQSAANAILYRSHKLEMPHPHPLSNCAGIMDFSWVATK